jgi:translocation and assembly module TamA
MLLVYIDVSSYLGLLFMIASDVYLRRYLRLLSSVFRLLVALCSLPCLAADPQPYVVSLNKTGDSAIDQALTEVSTLIRLNKQAPVGAFALVSRAQGDLTRFKKALHSLGYYQAQLELRIGKRVLTDPGIYDVIDFSPAKPPIPVEISITLGPLFHLGQVHIEGAVPKEAETWLALKANLPAQAKYFHEAGERLLNALHNEGYALATVAPPRAMLATATHTVEISYRVETGKKLRLGAITFTGLHSVNADFLRKRLLIASGDRYQPLAIEKTRLALLDTQVFSSVQVLSADQPDAEGRLPISFVMTERKPRSTSIGAAYSTDLGGNLTSTWQHHNIAGNAEQLNLTAAITQLGGNSSTGIGYNFSANFSKPEFLTRQQQLSTTLSAVKQNLIAYHQTAFTLDTSLSRQLTTFWQASIAVALKQAHITQADTDADYTLISLPSTLKYQGTNHLLDPSQGSLLSFSITPIQALTGQQTLPFVVLQATASHYLELSQHGRRVIAMRGMIGSTLGATVLDLPPDERFYAGGSATVRGYQYQSIGPHFLDGTPQGGTALITGTVEFRQRLYKDVGGVLFADIGQVNNTAAFVSGAWKIGAGIGARYYTKFGPLRVDVALPVNGQTHNNVELYVGLGQAF